MRPKAMCSVGLLLALVMLLAHALASGSDSSVQKIIDRYIRAVGDTALSAIKTETSTGTLTRGQAGGVPMTMWADSSGRWRYNQVFAWGDQVSFGFDGTEAWVKDTSGSEPMLGDQRLDLQLLMDFRVPLKLRGLFPTMTVTGSEGSGDSALDLLSVKSRDGYATELAFQRNSGYLVRAGAMRFEDYRDVGGVKRPHRIVLGAGPQGDHTPMTLQFAAIQHNLAIDDSTFRPPACVLRPQPSPVYKPQVRVDLDTASLDACAGVYQHPSDTSQRLIVSRQGSHLMLRRSSGGMEIEIKPVSATDFLIWFLRRDFHFLKDSLGNVASLVVGADSTKRWLRMK